MTAPAAHRIEWDLVVIGGGPAGLRAAAEVAEAGGRVVVVDENHRPGGKLRGQLHEEPGDHGWWKGGEIAALAEQRASDAGVEMLLDTVAWGVESGSRVHVRSHLSGAGTPSSTLNARAILVATGAVERPMPFPGWTLPGVMTIGAAQVLANIHRVKPGDRVLVAGVDVLSMTIARALALAGVTVVGIVLPPPTTADASPLATLTRMRSVARLAPAAYMRLGGRLLRWKPVIRIAATFAPRVMRVWGLRLQVRTALAGVSGPGTVTEATTVRVRADGTPIPGSEQTVQVDAVCLANGLIPLNELVAPLAIPYIRTEELGGPVPVHSDTFRTSVPGIYVTGNAVGIESAKIADEQGAVAALSIIEDLGLRTVTEAQAREAVRRLDDLRASMEFQFHPQVQQGHDQVRAAWKEAVS